MFLKLDLDSETARRLTEQAIAEYRPLPLHAVVVLRRALGLSVPTHQTTEPEPKAKEVANGAF